MFHCDFQGLFAISDVTLFFKSWQYDPLLALLVLKQARVSLVISCPLGRTLSLAVVQTVRVDIRVPGSLLLAVEGGLPLVGQPLVSGPAEEKSRS